MNQDPTVNRMREIAWRRPLTDAEARELREWLAAHPEARAEWEEEQALNRVIERLANAPVPSNFTARVMQEIERDTRAHTRADRPAAWWWRVFLPRAAFVGMLALAGLSVYLVNNTRRSARNAQNLVAVASVNTVLPREAQINFDVISGLNPGVPADEDLLKLLQ